MSLIKTLLRKEPESRFTLLYGNRDSSSVIFLETLAGAEGQASRTASKSIISSTRKSRTSTCSTGCWTASGWRRRSQRWCPMRREVDGWFICGPGPMMDAAEGALLDRNIPKERIHIERFTADRPPEAVSREMAQLQTKAEGVSVAVTLDGRTRRVPFTAGNILDSARASGLPAPFACKAGVCATCRAKVTKGKVEMAARYGLTDEEVAAGYVLTCQSVPLGDGVAVDYDA